MDKHTPIRKSPRLAGYDYSASRYYFITICTLEHKCLFGSVVSTKENGRMVLNENGKLVNRHLCAIGDRYSDVIVQNYVIMPNHIHMLLLLDQHNKASLSQIIGLFKSGVSKEMGRSVWQRSFHDHIIRNEFDYRSIWEYIENNPAQWAIDRYYVNDVSAG